MDSECDLPQLVEDLVSPSPIWDRSSRCLANSFGAFACAARTSSASETSRCCAPSCRSRSIRRRVASAVATIRAREASSSARLSALAIAVATISVNSPAAFEVRR